MFSINLRWHAVRKYDRKSVDARLSGYLVEAWQFLEHVQRGEIQIDPPRGTPKNYRVTTPSGGCLYFSIGRPLPTDIDADFDFFVEDFWLADELN